MSQLRAGRQSAGGTTATVWGELESEDGLSAASMVQSASFFGSAALALANSSSGVVTAVGTVSTVVLAGEVAALVAALVMSGSMFKSVSGS